MKIKLDYKSKVYHMEEMRARSSSEVHAHVSPSSVISISQVPDYFRPNMIYCGDNLDVLRKFPEKCIDLIYADPPFFSNKHYEIIWDDGHEIRAFKDRWKGGIEHFVLWMRERLEECYRVLKDTGLMYLHCDWHANAHLRILMDSLFGVKNLRNEIIWCYRGAGTPKKDFSRRHDTIFRYSKSKNYTFNVDDVREEYAEATKERFKHYIGNIREGINFGTQKLNPKGKHPDDWWQIQPIAPSAKERLGYPTQKPEILLSRIIKASSNPVDIVLDPFCGCGTAIAVAHKLGRRWIGIDVSPTSCKIIEKRMNSIAATGFNIIGMPMSLEDLKALEPFEFQNWVIQRLHGRVSQRRVWDMGIDGYTYEGNPVQVKQSEKVGRNVVDNFETALRRANKDSGLIVAFSFSRGAYEEIARAKLHDGLDIEAVKVEDLLKNRRNRNFTQTN